MKLKVVRFFLIAFVSGLLQCTIACNSNNKDEAAAKNNPSNPDTLGLSSGDRILELNQLILNDPNNPDHYFQRAYANYYMVQVEEAIADIKMAIKLAPNNASYYFAKGLFFHGTLAIEEAKTAFEQCLELDPNFERANLYVSKIYLALYRYDKVFEYVNNELRINVNNPEAYFLKGVAYEESRDTANALSSYITAVEQDVDYYEAYIRLGLIYSKRKDPIALEFYKNAFRIRPTSIEVLYNTAIYHQEVGNLDDAVATYSQILDLNPNYALAYYNLGYLYLEYDTAYTTAIDNFRKALANNPGNFLKYTFYNLGLAYERMGDKPKARDNYKEAIKLDGDYDDAIKGYNRVLR